jgi:hypothetical protein
MGGKVYELVAAVALATACGSGKVSMESVSPRDTGECLEAGIEDFVAAYVVACECFNREYPERAVDDCESEMRSMVLEGECSGCAVDVDACRAAHEGCPSGSEIPEDGREACERWTCEWGDWG